MEQNKTWLLRRILETLVIEVISSCLLYLFVMAKIIPSTRGGYIGGFGASAVTFLALSYIALRTHFWVLHFNIFKYLTVNLSICGVMALLSGFGLKYLPNNIYTAFFGYTKPFRLIFDMSPVDSAVLFWAIYLISIIFVIIKTLYFDYEYKEIQLEEFKDELSMTNIDFIEHED